MISPPLSPILQWAVAHWPRGVWREIGWIVLGESTGSVGALIGVRILSGQLTPSVYGQVSLASTFVVLALQLGLGPIGAAFERFYAMALSDGTVAEYVHMVFRLTSWASLVVVALGSVIALTIWQLGLLEWLPLTIAAVVLTVGSGWEGVLDAVQNGARRRRFVAWHRAMRQWLRPFLAGAIVLAFGAQSTAAMCGFALGSLAVICSQLLLFRRSFTGLPAVTLRGDVIDQLRRRMIAYAAPVCLWNLCTVAQLSSDRWALGLYTSTDQVGLYSVLLQLGANPVHLIGALVLQIAAPIVYSRAGNRADPVRLASAMRLSAMIAGGMFIAALLMTLVAVLASDLVFRLLAGPAFRSVAPLLPLAVLAAGTFEAGQLLTVLAMTLEKPGLLALPKVGTLILAVAINLASAALFGLAGVVVGGILFAAVYATLVLLVSLFPMARLCVYGSVT